MCFFSIGYITGYLLETFVFYFVFSYLRSYTNGYHCKTRAGCIILSVITYLFATLFIKKYFLIINKYSVLLMIVFGLLIIKIAPINSMQICFSKYEIEQHKVKVRRIVFLIFIICSIIFIVDPTSLYLAFVLSAVFLDMISLIVAKFHM